MIAFGADVIKKFGIEVGKKTNVVNEGDKTREMYIVHKGKLEVVKKQGDAEHILGYMKEGDFFGELSLLNNEPRSATVRAVERSVILKINPASFEALIKKYPDLSLKIIKALAARLQTTTEQVVSLQEQDDDVRFLKTVVSKLHTVGQKTTKGIRVSTTLEEIANEINTKTASYEAVKADLENASNVIQFLKEGAFEVRDMDLLEEFVHFVEARKKFIREQGGGGNGSDTSQDIMETAEAAAEDAVAKPASAAKPAPATKQAAPAKAAPKAAAAKAAAKPAAKPAAKS